MATGESVKLQLTGGALSMELYAADGTTLGSRFAFGSTDEITLSTEVEEIEHYSTETSSRKLDGKDVTSRSATIAFTTADIHTDILSKAYLGTVTDVTQTAATAQAVNFASVSIGERLDLGYRNVTEVVVKDVTDLITYTEGVDYELFDKSGAIVILAGGSISEADEIHTTVTAPAATYKQIDAMKEDAIYGRLTFSGDASVGESHEYVFEKVSLKASGDITLKSSEYTTISFEGSVLETSGKYYTVDIF